MKNALRALAFLAFLVFLLPAAAQVPQFPQNLPANTVVGRLGVGPGPSQAIPFANLLPNIFGPQSANKVYAGPASGGVALPTFRSLVGTDLPTPGASSLGGVQSLTCSTSNWFRTLSTGGIFGCSQPNFSDLVGQATLAQLPTIGANTVLGSIGGGTPAALSQTQLTSLINPATASLSGALPAWPNNTTTYFRGDGTYQTHNCAALSGVGPGCSAAAGQLPGEPSTGSASAGNVGEYVESFRVTGSAIALTTGAPATVTSIGLTAGDWDVDCVIYFNSGGSTVLTSTTTSLSLTTNTLDLTAGRWGQQAMNLTGPPTVSSSVPPYRFSFSTTTNVFLVAQAGFTTSTEAAWGIIRARRVR